MHDINYIRQHTEDFIKAMEKRFVKIEIEKILSLEKKKRSLTTDIQDLQSQRNIFSKKIGENKNNKEDREIIIAKVNNIKDDLKLKEEELLKISNNLKSILLSLPNKASPTVPVGENESSNKLIYECKDFKKKPDGYSHDNIGNNLRMMDFETAAKISGSRFVILTSHLAKLERALYNFMIDVHVQDHGYEEVSTPHLVNEKALLGTGQLPKFKRDLFEVTNNKWLIPTAEVTLSNMQMGKIVSEENLPLRYVGLTNCFRSEAGSAGKDTKGMIRLHEFKKVELVSFVAQENSDEELERLTKCSSKILDLLEIPYRITLLSSGDMGFSASKTYDIEVWLPSQKKYREISSCSNCGDFQARRMNSRYKNLKNEKFFMHTLNGSGLAVGRALVAILENYQIKNNLVKIPKVLVKYMNGIKQIGIIDD